MKQPQPTFTRDELARWVTEQQQLAHSEWEARCPCGHSPASHAIRHNTKSVQSLGGAYHCRYCECERFRGA